MMAMTGAEKSRLYRERHPDRVRAAVRKYQSADPERTRRQSRKTKTKHAVRILLRNRERTRAYFKAIALLKDVPCADCGNRFPPACMDFDHVRGEKKFVMSRAAHAPRRALNEEIAKCDVVCANCHRIRTSKRKATRPSPGRPAGEHNVFGYVT